MALYYVTGFHTGAVVSGDPLVQLWNPSTTKRIKVLNVAYFVADNTGGTALRWRIVRSTARGTVPGLTVTPDADNEAERAAAPGSGMVLEFGPFTTQPTQATPALASPGVTPATTNNNSSGFVLPLPRGIVVPPGSGLCIVGEGTDMFNHQASFVVED